MWISSQPSAVRDGITANELIRAVGNLALLGEDGDTSLAWRMVALLADGLRHETGAAVDTD